MNRKQYLICKKVLSHVLFAQSSQENNVSSSQLLLYIEKEKEVKKSQIIKTIICAMNLLSKNDQLIVMNFIEVAVDNVNDFIIYSSLDIEIDKKVFKITRERVRKL